MRRHDVSSVPADVAILATYVVTAKGNQTRGPL